MGIHWFLNHLNTHFNAEDKRDLILSYRRDPLVWKAITTIEHPEDWIALAGNNLFNWQVAKFALFTLRQTLFDKDYRDLDADIPEDLYHKSERLLEAIRTTGLEPNNLADAGLLALALRNLRLEDDGWHNLPEFLSLGNRRLDTWKTAFVVLPALVPDLDQAFTTLIDQSTPQNVDAIIAIILHVTNTQNLPENERYQLYTWLALDAGMDFQLGLLKQLNDYESPAFIRLLASSFLDSEAEHDEADNSFTHICSLRKRALLKQIAGLNDESVDTVQEVQQRFQTLRASFLNNLAKDLEKIQPEEARKTWEEVLSLDPDNETYISQYAEFLIVEGDVHQALYLLNTLSDRSATMLYALRYPEFAAILPGGTFEMDPDQMPQLLANQKSRFLELSDKYQAAELAFEQKNYDLASEMINKALIENPNHLDSIKLAGQINQRLANLQSAIQNYALLSTLETENAEYKNELTQLYIQAHEPQKALETFGELIQSNAYPSRDDMLYYANLGINAGQPELAIPIAKNFLAQDSLDGEAMVILAEAYIKSDRNEEARDLLSQASALAPEKPASWLALARIWTILGENDSALSALQKAQVALPQDAQILTALGKLYLEQGQASEAVSTLKQAIQLEADNLEASIALTSALLMRGNSEEAWETIQAFENDYSTNPQLALVLAETLAARNETQRANTIYKFAWQSLRSNEALLAYMQNLLNQIEPDLEESKAVLDDLNTLLPTLQDRNATYDASFEMKLVESDVKAQLGQLQEAYEDYQYLLDLPEAKAPRFYQHLQRQLGLVALDLGFEDISMASLQEAISFNPNDLASRHALSQAYLKSDLQEKAIESAQTALQLAPTDTNNVLWFSKFMQANQRPHDAIQALKDAIYLRPEEQILHLSLARVYLAQNALDESKITLSKMLETADIPTADYLNIAKLYARMDVNQLATDILQRAIDENENPSFVESCQITYKLLDLQQSVKALSFLNKIRQKHGAQTAFSLIKADVLTADNQYLSAFEALEPLLRKLEGGELESIQSAFNPEEDHDYLPFNEASVYLRAAYLQRALANFDRAGKFAHMALQRDANNEKARLFSLDVAMASLDRTYLDQVLEDLNNKQHLDETDISLAKWLTLDAMLENDLTKTSLIFEHFLNHNQQDAIPMVAKALINEQDGQAHQAMAFLQVLKDQYANASETTQKQPSLSQQFATIWQELALALLAWKLQDWTFANQLFCQSTRIFKANPRLNLTFADYLADKARMQKNADLLKIKRHRPKAVTESRSDASIFDEQMTLAKSKLEPVYMQSVESLGRAYFDKQMPESFDLEAMLKNSHFARQAIAVLDTPASQAKILAAFPHDHDLEFQYALKILEKQPEKAKETLNKLPVKPNMQAFYYAALAMAEQSQFDAAEDAINRALAVWPDEPEWLALKAGFQKEQGNLTGASESISQALDLEPNQASLWQAQGGICMAQKDLQAAKSHFEKANSLKYNIIPVIESLADINQQLGEFPEAINYFKELHILEPEQLSYLESLAELYFMTQEFELALETADKVIDNSLNCERALKVKIETLIAQKKFDEAKKLANDAMLIAKDPISFEIYRIRIEGRENPATGLRMATNLALEHPDYPSVLNLLAQYQMVLEQNQNAEKTLRHSLELDDKNPETLLALGTLNRLSNSHEIAQTYLKKAIELNPGIIEAYLELGQSLQDQRLDDQALQIYNKAIEQVSKDPRPYVYAANAYKASRDFRSAELMLQQAAQLAPSDQSIRRQLSAVVAQNLLDNLQEAPKRK